MIPVCMELFDQPECAEAFLGPAAESRVTLTK